MVRSYIPTPKKNLLILILSLTVSACGGLKGGILSENLPLENPKIPHSELSVDSLVFTSGTVVRQVEDGDTIEIGELGDRFSLEAATSGNVVSVEFIVNGQSTIAQSAPFYVQMDVAAGTFAVQALPYAKSGARGGAGKSLAVTFHLMDSSVLDPTPPPIDEPPPPMDEPPQEPLPPPSTANTFSCLDGKTDKVLVTGMHDRKYSPSTAKDRVFDARQAEFLIKYDSHGMITLSGSSSHTGMCWAGGYVISDQPWDASWADHKASDGQPTGNSTVFNNSSTNATLTGLHFFNIHDGPRGNNGINWVVQHVWGEYIRDDAIENDHFHSGMVYDSLFDGTYQGISTRPSSSSEDEDDGTGQVLWLEKILVRLQAMPYPYKWESRSGNIDENGNPWKGTGIPYKHGSWFKYYDEDNDNGDRDTKNSHFVIIDSVFAASHIHVGSDRFDLPAPKLIDRCENVTIAWLGDEKFVGHSSIDAVRAAFPNCITILEGEKARSFWKQKVTDWHQRHPEVGEMRKPKNPGEVIFPLIF